jgi:GGDEF domain-containing protein
MPAAPKIRPSDLERRETQLTLFACAAIAILGGGTALLMYPVVFSHQSDKTTRIAFVGFCTLCLLLAGYLWERQSTIGRLRQQMAEERMKVARAQQEASTQLLKTMPNFASFQDRLPMEYRRTIATTQKLSVLVVSVLLPKGMDASLGTSLFGDAAKVISRKLREQDSIYILAEGCFGVVLPGSDAGFARNVHDRITDGLADAAGVGNRFTCKINVVNFPDDAKSAHELESAVSALMPSGNSMRDMAQAIHSTAV